MSVASVVLRPTSATTLGSKPTPSWTSRWNWRLAPLGHAFSAESRNVLPDGFALVIPRKPEATASFALTTFWAVAWSCRDGVAQTPDQRIGMTSLANECMTAMAFEPVHLLTGSWSQRLATHGQIAFGTSGRVFCRYRCTLCSANTWAAAVGFEPARLVVLAPEGIVLGQSAYANRCKLLQRHAKS